MNALKHGHYTAKALAERQFLRELLRETSISLGSPVPPAVIPAKETGMTADYLQMQSSDSGSHSSGKGARAIPRVAGRQD